MKSDWVMYRGSSTSTEWKRQLYFNHMTKGWDDICNIKNNYSGVVYWLNSTFTYILL